MRFWYLFVAVCVLAWIMIVVGFGYWSGVTTRWPIAAVMVLGSIVAGSTPMGGGTVAFPFLVLAFGQTPDHARNFGLAIQALGMTSAMIFIFCRRIPVQGRMIAWTSVGAALGIVVGNFLIAPYCGRTVLKLMFSCLWMSFAVLTLLKNREICLLKGARPIDRIAAMEAGLAVGLIGGAIASMIGTGVELALFTVLVLLYKTDLKVAVPSAVSAMAVASLMGTGLHAAIGDLDRDVLWNVLAAGPVALLGAPLGSYLASVVSRVRILYFVSCLCVLQFVWTLTQVSSTAAEWSFVTAALLIVNAGFYLLYRHGEPVKPADRETRIGYPGI